MVSSTPRSTSPHARIFVTFAWLSALLWILPTGANGQGVCDRTPQVRDKLVEITGVSGCARVTRGHLAGVRELDLSESGITALQEHDFSGLSSLRSLVLYQNSLTALPEAVFSGLNSLESLWLGNNSLNTLPAGVFQGLHSLERLSLINNTLSILPEGVFSSLNSLESLSLSNNSLTALPERIFSGLRSLESLRLWINQLSSLPAGVFRDLHSLTTLWLSNNSLNKLPPGIFDDILDTLGPDTGVFGDLWVDPYLKATIAFVSTEQTGLKGTTVRAKVTLSRALPVAVRVPYSVGGTATADDYRGLSPDPETGLLFLAGETSKEIRLTLLERRDSLGKTIVLTLGELSQIGLRRSDGTGPDAPYLKAETLVDRPDEQAVHTVTISSSNQMAGICDRTPQVRDKLMEVTGVSACAQMTLGHLAGVTRLDLSGTGITGIQAEDFRGLSSLRVLWLQNNPLSELPRGVFDDLLETLEDLRVDPYLKATLGLPLMEQEVVEGGTVWVKVWLNRRLPVAVRVPYEVGGTGSEYARLSPAPSDGLLFLAGQTRKEIEVTLSEGAESVGKTIELTLGELSQIGLRRSDGGGEDAPRLDSRVLLDRPADGVVHTITVTNPNEPANVCDRTPQVREKLLELTRSLACEDITTAQLAGIKQLALLESGITTLRENDFKGLSSLQILHLSNNSLSALPNGIFGGLSNLEQLGLVDNLLSELPDGIFSGLNSLGSLLLSSNAITTLPQGVFSGLSNLHVLWLNDNLLSELPDGIFSGLNSLRNLLLNSNAITTLPQGVFSGLSNLHVLWLNDNLLSELPDGIFSGLNSLRILLLYRNATTALPQEIFSGLSNLEHLGLDDNSLDTLSEGIFSGLNSLKLLGLGATSLRTLPENVFHGLSSLQSLSLHQNSLSTLTENVFQGLSALRKLCLSGNNLTSLPEGVFDDMLATLGRPVDPVISSSYFELSFSFTFGENLHVDAQLKATLTFASASQRAVEGTTVRVPVTLSRVLPVAVRVPYSVGFSGTTGGYTNLSPAPDNGLLFLAGETQREITLTLLKDAVPQVERDLVLTLGKPSEIRLRRSDGTGPDAPHLKTDSLVLRSDEAATHTITVADSDPVDQDPYCLSLWGGLPCSTVSTLPHVFMGPLGENLAKTEVVVTHRDPQPSDCEVALLFHQGTSPASAVSFNGQFLDQNLLHTTLPRGGAEILTLTAPDAGEMVVGALYVFTRSPCSPNSLHVQGRYLLESQSDGEIEELFSVPGQSEKDWLGDGDCRVLTGVFGSGRNLGLTSVTAQPGQSAPPGTRLRFAEFDLKGNFIGGLPSLEISGRHQALSPWEFDQPTIIQMCLDVPGTSDFQLAVAATGTMDNGTKVQFSNESFPSDPEQERP